MKLPFDAESVLSSGVEHLPGVCSRRKFMRGGVTSAVMGWVLTAERGQLRRIERHAKEHYVRQNRRISVTVFRSTQRVPGEVATEFH